MCMCLPCECMVGIDTTYKCRNVTCALVPSASTRTSLKQGLDSTSPALSIGLLIEEDGHIDDVKIVRSTVKVTRKSYAEAQELLEQGDQPWADMEEASNRFRLNPPPPSTPCHLGHPATCPHASAGHVGRCLRCRMSFAPALYVRPLLIVCLRVVLRVCECVCVCARASRRSTTREWCSWFPGCFRLYTSTRAHTHKQRHTLTHSDTQIECVRLPMRPCSLSILSWMACKNLFPSANPESFFRSCAAADAAT
jgi:hypothetical protein